MKEPDLRFLMTINTTIMTAATIKPITTNTAMVTPTASPTLEEEDSVGVLDGVVLAPPVVVMTTVALVVMLLVTVTVGVAVVAVVDGAVLKK